MIDWGAESCFVILLEEEYLHMIGWSRWPMVESRMISQYAEILKENHSCIALVKLSGVLEV